MKSLNPKVVVVFFIKNFLGTVYILPLWFLGIFILEHVWTNNVGIVYKDFIILLLDLAGCIFFGLLVMACYYWSCLTFIHFTYELKQDGLHIHSGVFLRRQIIIPYTDIDTVELLINPLVIYFLQLYTLQIKTHDLVNTEGTFRKKQIIFLPGLTSETARFLRAELLKDSHILVRKAFLAPH